MGEREEILARVKNLSDRLNPYTDCCCPSDLQCSQRLRHRADFLDIMESLDRAVDLKLIDVAEAIPLAPQTMPTDDRKYNTLWRWMGDYLRGHRQTFGHDSFYEPVFMEHAHERIRARAIAINRDWTERSSLETGVYAILNRDH